MKLHGTNKKLGIVLMMILIILIIEVPVLHAANIQSPDGKYTVNFNVTGGRLYYNVYHEGTQILADSKLGFSLSGLTALSDNFQLNNTSYSSNNTNWTPVTGIKNTYPDNYNQMVINVSETTGSLRQLQLTFRAYNEGIAFYSTIPEQTALENFTITDENTEFHFTGNHYCWYTNYPQGIYDRRTLSSIGTNSCRPLIVETGTKYIAVAEAKLVNYAPMMLQYTSSNTIITNLRSNVTATDPVSTPWRVIMAANTPGKLLENSHLISTLNDPCALTDTSWIKPGKCWRDGSLTMATSKQIIDRCVELNFQYVHWDAGWYGPENDVNSNPTVVSKNDLNINEMVQYAHDRGKGVILYINHIAMENYDLDNTFSTYQSWGVDGVKFGFVNYQTQANMEWLHQAVRKAAQYHLVVDIHDNYRPTGYSRTYPNLLQVEGICGNEVSAANGNTPANVLSNAFARGIAGPADFTPCYFNSRVVSRAFQLALGVVFYGPLQYLFWYDGPSAYTGQPEIEFWKAMPTTWDDTKVINGTISQYITVARKKGDQWFVGSLTDASRTLDIPLSFLDPGKDYTAKVYSKDPNNSLYVVVNQSTVRSTDTIQAVMSEDGGHAIWLYPVSTTTSTPAPTSTPTPTATPTPTPASTPTTAPGTVYLSDLNWASWSGYQEPRKDTNRGGGPIILNGVTYAKGIGTHAASEIIYNFAGSYSRFLSDVGVDDAKDGYPASIVFQVWADGVKVYDSGIMYYNTVTKSIDLNITGVNQLKLIVTDAGDGISNDHADWANARLIPATAPAPHTLLNPNADAFVRNGTYANTNYGANSSLDLKDSGTDYYREAFLKFDLNGITGNITSAKLKLYFTSGVLPVGVSQVSVDSWTESGITYNNRPSVGTELASVSVTSSATWYEWDITSYVAGQATGDKVVSLCVKAKQTEINAAFASRESSYKPVLEIN